LAVLMDFIKQTAGGGTAEQRAQRAERNVQIQSARGTLGDYTKQSAFTDAAELMAQNLRKSLEANMPAISRSIQGAGTSASSMQGLLSQKLATESAQAASALGAEQAKSYGSISTGLQGVLEALTRIDPSIEANLLKALDLTKVSRQSQSSVTNPTAPTKQVGQSGGGSYWQPFEQAQQQNPATGSYAQQALAPISSGAGQGFVVNEDTGAGTIFGGPSAGQFYSPPSYDYSPAQEEDFSQNFGDAGWGYGD
jgi:hypothetical protein